MIQVTFPEEDWYPETFYSFSRPCIYPTLHLHYIPAPDGRTSNRSTAPADTPVPPPFQQPPAAVVHYLRTRL